MLIFKYYKYRNINKYCKYRRKYKLQIYLGLLISSNLICVIRLSNLYSISPVNTHYCYIIFFRILMVILEQESKFDPNKKQEQKKYLLPEKKYKTTKLQLIYLLLSKGKEQRSLSWCGFWTGKELQHIKTHSPMIYIYVCVCVYIYIYIYIFFFCLPSCQFGIQIFISGAWHRNSLAEKYNNNIEQILEAMWGTLGKCP